MNEADRRVIVIKGLDIIVDPEDAEKILALRWHRTNYVDGPYFESGKTNRIRLHRWLVNCPDGMQVDHINGNPLDNRKSNLRICTSRQNSRNKVNSARNTSGAIGVYYSKNRRKWHSYIMVDYRQLHIGSFESFNDALDARRNAEVQYYGEYAKQA